MDAPPHVLGACCNSIQHNKRADVMSSHPMSALMGSSERSDSILTSKMALDSRLPVASMSGPTVLTEESAAAAAAAAVDVRFACSSLVEQLEEPPDAGACGTFIACIDRERSSTSRLASA